MVAIHHPNMGDGAGMVDGTRGAAGPPGSEIVYMQDPTPVAREKDGRVVFGEEFEREYLSGRGLNLIDSQVGKTAVENSVVERLDAMACSNRK